MIPQFTMQYGEFAVADFLTNNIKNSSVFIPSSPQEKGIDLLLYRYQNNSNMTNTIQVKMSRSYENKKWSNILWFNRFKVPENADWIILVGIYAEKTQDQEELTTNIKWNEIMLAFTNEEMKKFMSEVRQKKDPEKNDRMFAFGFNNPEKIYQTRGYHKERCMSEYLIQNRLKEIEDSFK